ncbi:MAG: YbjN domain-containing protein [Proteobacteria bacterium]|nr:YbjN domain-containing protein [Pseudomonadota bacterium]
MSKTDAYDEHSDEKIEHLIDEYVSKFFSESGEEVVRIRHNIWNLKEPYYSFNIIITSLLVIFDAILFEYLPENKHEFFEELLSLNAHQAKSSKLCLVKDAIHLRIIRGLEDFDYSEFVAHVEEYREIFPEMKEKLTEKYYPEEV